MSLEPENRINVITYIKIKLPDVFPTLIRDHFPEVEGLAADEETLLLDVIDVLPDEDLEVGSRLEGDEFLDWSRALMQKWIIDAWFREDIIDVLIDHVGDVLSDQSEVSDEQVRRVVSYYSKRAGTSDLLTRFDDGPEKWLKLIELADRDRDTDDDSTA